MANGGSELKPLVETDESAGVLKPANERPGSHRAWGPGPVVAVSLLVAAIAAVAWMHRRQPPSTGAPFELIDASNGHLVTDRDFRGKWLLVFFGYTHCPDVCPTTLSAIADRMAKLGALAEEVQPLFITVDPERDTRQVLKEYTDEFDARIHGLTGTPDQIAVAAKAYGAYYARREIGDDYYMDHTGATYLMRPTELTKGPSSARMALEK
jgi:protein SCO1/2